MTQVNMVGKGLCCLRLLQESETQKGNLNLEFSDQHLTVQVRTELTVIAGVVHLVGVLSSRLEV